MKRVVFFDFYNTLVHFDPPREELHRRACLQAGISIGTRELRRALPIADEYYHRESLSNPIRKRPPEEQKVFFTNYELLVLKEAGVDGVSPEVAFAIVNQVRQELARVRLTLYDDVIPTMDKLKEIGLILGLISNIDRDISPNIRELGLEPYLNPVVTSVAVGVGKPDPGIFLAALQQVRASPEEAVHIGDNYRVDILGAKRVGITALLIDREDNFPEITDCPRLRSLDEVLNYL